MFRRLLRPLAVSSAATLVALGAVELAFQLKPEWLPVAYRRSLPLKGQELIAPEIARSTPVDGVALPTAMWMYDGPAPADLIEMGLAPESAREATPERVLLTLDELGLPNAEVAKEADVVLLGDSFVYSMGAQEPPGLATRLAEARSISTYCVGVTGIGPYQELFLLKEICLNPGPQRVIWFVFGGNDLQGASATLSHMDAGRESLMERLWPEGPPLLKTRDLARWALSQGESKSLPPAHPGVAVPGGGSQHLTWFHPEYTSALAIDPEILDQWPAYEGLVECIDEGARYLSSWEVDLWVVYLPSKAECYLPLLEADQEEAFMEQCFYGRTAPERESWPGLIEQMRSHIGVLGSRLGDECAARGIRYFDATGILRDEMAAGRPPYFAADTHLGIHGQQRLLQELLDRWDEPAVAPPPDREGTAAPAGDGPQSEG